MAAGRRQETPVLGSRKPALSLVEGAGALADYTRFGEI